MKKLKYLLLIVLSILMLPLGVFAEGEDGEVQATSEEESKEVIVYFFRGEGCSHCAEAEEWFASIEEEMGDKYTIKDYETWSDKDNADLMSRVAEVRGESDTATGVPYIIIGNKSWIGFNDTYKEEITAKINELYDQEIQERYDVMDFLSKEEAKQKEKSASSDIISLLAIIVVCGALGTGIYFARKQNAITE